jgi:two-component system NarL family response regulator
VNTQVEEFEGTLVPGAGRVEGPSGVSGSRPDLTPRQLEILSLIARARSNKEIAGLLGISERTVKFHVAALFKKLCAVSRTEALVVALRLRLIELDIDA